MRKIEEIQISEDLKTLKQEKGELLKLIASDDLRWARIDDEIAAIKQTYGARHAFGKRRTTFEAPPLGLQVPIEAVIEKEPVTIICSTKGWMRSQKGHVDLSSDVKYKEGDSQRFAMHVETTDKLLVLSSSGRFYTLSVDKIPGGRGFGEPIRLLIDLGDDEIVTMFPYHPSQAEKKYLVVANDGRGFVVKTTDLVAQTKAGKQILNVAGKGVAKRCVLVEGEHVAVVGENRKLLIFKIDELPEMTKGRGVKLQFYRDGGLSDVKTFNSQEGLTWNFGSRKGGEKDIRSWIGRRSQSGRFAPIGFPRSNLFRPLSELEVL